MHNHKETIQIGLWMDHSEAVIIHLDGQIRTIKASGVGHLRIPGEAGDGTKIGNFRSTNNEIHKEHKHEHELHAFYNHIYDALKPYNDIVIFGPSTAHSEFHNYILKHNKSLTGKLGFEKSDYMTENQLVAFVKDYFKNRHLKKEVH